MAFAALASYWGTSELEIPAVGSRSAPLSGAHRLSSSAHPSRRALLEGWTGYAALVGEYDDLNSVA
jgi:hypothetical protein